MKFVPVFAPQSHSMSQQATQGPASHRALGGASEMPALWGGNVKGQGAEGGQQRAGWISALHPLLGMDMSEHTAQPSQMRCWHCTGPPWPRSQWAFQGQKSQALSKKALYWGQESVQSHPASNQLHDWDSPWGTLGPTLWVSPHLPWLYLSIPTSQLGWNTSTSPSHQALLCDSYGLCCVVLFVSCLESPSRHLCILLICPYPSSASSRLSISLIKLPWLPSNHDTVSTHSSL